MGRAESINDSDEVAAQDLNSSFQARPDQREVSAAADAVANVAIVYSLAICNLV